MFVFSITVYGNERTPLLESTVPQPEDQYGISSYPVEFDLNNEH
jgi:UDP-glucose 4-epimerase